MPREREKNACPRAVRIATPLIVEKSTFSMYFRPSSAPGRVQERIIRAISMMNSRGIRSLDIFSIPAVPWLMIYAVKNKKMKGKMTAPCKGNVPSAPSRLFRK